MATKPNWYVSVGDDESQRSLASEWGIAGASIEFNSQGKDVWTFRIPKRRFDEARVFEYGAKLFLFKSSTDAQGQTFLTNWFTGWAIKPKGRGGARGEGQDYMVVGPWYWLEETVWQQIWYYYTSGGVKTPEYTSHLMLNGTADGISFVSTKDTIRAALQYVLDQFAGEAPFQIGTISLPTLYPPVSEVRDTSVSEVINLQLRWHPDAVTYFDYSQNPPILHIKPHAELAAVTLKTAEVLSAGESAYVENVELESREDLQRPSVVIRWEVKGELDGRPVLNLVTDKWPVSATGREIGALMYTVDALGPTQTTLRASVVSEDLPDAATDNWAAASQLDFWKREFIELGNDRIANITIVEAGRLRLNDDGTTTALSTQPGDGKPAGLRYKLLSGGVADWMGGSAQRERISVKVKFEVYDEAYNASASPAQTPIKSLKEAQIFTKEITTTDVPSGDYSGGVVTEEEGDLIWLGLARALYDPLQILHYSGSLSLLEEEASGRARPGHKINVAGSAIEYASMNAMVMSTREDLDNGGSAITVGPARQWTVAELVALLQVNRVRRRVTALGAQADGGLGAGNAQTDFPKGPNTDRGVGSDDLYKLWTVKEGQIKLISDAPGGRIHLVDDATAGGTGGARSITLALGSCVGGGANRQLSVREVEVCVNGVTRHMLVVGSETY